jgi:ABC-type nitrate/sulfonate/bicarbonate transport system substrate-binding protein
MAETIKLNAGFATIGQGAGPMMVTWKAGLFHKYGLEVDRPRIMGGAKGVVRGLMSDEIRFGNLAAPAALRANLKSEADASMIASNWPGKKSVSLAMEV